MEITSTFLRPNKPRLSKGESYRGVIKYRDADGTIKQISTTFDNETVRTASKANAALAAWRKKVEFEHAAPDAGKNVADYVSDYISTLEAAKSVEPSTIKGYRSTLEYIKDGFVGVSMRDLRPQQVQRWERDLIERGLSSSTVGKGHRLLKQVCKHAVEVEDLLRNPCDPVKPPQRTKTEPNALDSDGRAKVLGVLSKMELEPLSVAAYIALFTGMRRGEICALTWGDVDLDRNEIAVSKALGAGVGGTYLKTPKTGRGRVVPIHRQLSEILARYRIVKRAEWMQATFTDDAPTTDAEFSKQYVLGTPDGRFCNPTRLGKDWQSLSKLCRFMGTEGRPCTFHDLRHTFATIAISEGADVRSVAAILGHANVAMTLNVYASADAEAKRRAAEIVGKALEFKPAEVFRLDRTGTDE